MLSLSVVLHISDPVALVVPPSSDVRVDLVKDATEMIVELVHRPSGPRRTWRKGCLYNQFARRNECPDECCHSARVLSKLTYRERGAVINAALPRCVDRLVSDALDDDRLHGRSERFILQRNLAANLSMRLKLVNVDIVQMYDMDASFFDQAVKRAGWQTHPDYAHLLIPVEHDPTAMRNIELNQRVERALNRSWTEEEAEILNRTMRTGGTPADAKAELRALRARN